MGDIDLGRALQSFTRSAWRLETLDLYTAPSEAQALADWRAGRTPVNEAWTALVRSHVTAGRTIGRVHAIHLPISDYIRFAIATYQASAAAGETIGIVEREAHPELAEDFWLFDDRRVAVMRYDADGRFIGATDGTHRLDHYRRLRDAAVTAATPLADWTPVAH